MQNEIKDQTFFAAMNTQNGFRSYFGEIFSMLDRLYIIKGGPGTGKSRLMREISAKAKENGFSVEEFLCSSDPTSLDGIIIPELSVGVIDGTSPHTYEPKTPGAVENSVDLGRFWDSRRLAEKTADIKKINRAKARLYSSVYSYLAVVSECDKITISLTETALQSEKLERFVKREASHLAHDSAPSKKIRIRSAISCDGILTLASFSEMSSDRRAVLDCSFSGGIFLSRLLAESDRIGVSSVVSYSPFRPDTPDAIYYPTSNVVYYLGSEGDYTEKTINMRRFLDNRLLSPFKGKLRAVSRIRGELLTQMRTDFRSIKRLHSELEGIYAGAMDFERKEAERDRIIGEIFE